MAIEALGTPVSASALRTMVSTLSRSVAGIGGGGWACRSVVASKIRTTRRFPNRGELLMHDSLEPNTIRPSVRQTEPPTIASRNYNSDHVARRIQTQAAV